MTGGMNGRARRARFMALAALVLAGCMSAGAIGAGPEPAGAGRRRIGASASSKRASTSSAAAFAGEVGIAVREVDTGWTTSWNGDRYFPQQSVSKFWVAITAFAARRRRPSSTSPAKSPSGARI